MRPFLDSSEYEKKLRSHIGEKDYRRYCQFAKSIDTEEDRSLTEYYDFIGHYSRSGLFHSKKMLALAAQGANIEPILPRTGKILDVGTNIGWLATWYAGKSTERELIGLDIAPRCIHEATKAAKRLNIKNAKFLTQNALDFSPPYQLDAIVDTAALCDLNAPQPYFRKVKSLLIPGGLFISVPSKGTPAMITSYLEELHTAGLETQHIGYHASKDLGESAVYPLIVAKSDGEIQEIDVKNVYRGMMVALSFLHWNIFLRARQDTLEVSLFIPGKDEDPELIQEGDKVIDVNGKAIHQLTSSDLDNFYKLDKQYLLRFQRGENMFEVCYK